MRTSPKNLTLEEQLELQRKGKRSGPKIRVTTVEQLRARHAEQDRTEAQRTTRRREALDLGDER